MIDLAEEYIRKGDFIIISPEQSEQTLSTYFNPSDAWKTLDECRGKIFDLEGEKTTAMLAGIPSYVGTKINYLSNSISLDPDGIYRRSAFNEYGDIADLRMGNILPDGVDTNHPISFSQRTISEDFIECLNAFSRLVKRKGARLYYRFAPSNASSIVDVLSIDGYYDYLSAKLDFPILGNPRNSILEKEWFYDTNYHLNSAGAIKFTKSLVQDIKLLNGDSSKTNIEDPEKPALTPSTIEEGDNSQADLYRYEETSSGYKIVGLNEAAFQEEHLIIPYSKEGKPITSFSPTLFEACDKLRSITIQSNIQLIIDHSFAIPSLERIILLNEEPSKISIGEHLLDGTSAFIYVKKDCYADYLVDYSWSFYANRLKANED